MIAALLLALSPIAAGDLAGALAALRAPEAAERAAGQRWIEVHAGPGDAPALADAAAGGDAELRARLAAALGAADHNLGLAVELAASDAPAAAAVGREAVERSLARWLPGVARPVLTGAGALAALSSERLRARYERLRIDVTGPTALVLERLARAEPGIPPLAVDPAVDEGARPRDARGVGVATGVEGTWDAIAAHVARTRLLDLEVVLAEAAPDDGGERRVALALILRQGEAGLCSPAERVAGWCLAVVSDVDGARPATSATPVASASAAASRESAALALAATGWPAALGWLEERWTARGDLAAREGLLAAAARGRVASALREPERAAALLAELDGVRPGPATSSGPGTSGAAAMRALGALIAVGPLLAGGADHCERACAAADLAPRTQWVRFALIEGWRSCCERGAAAVAAALAAAPGAVADELRLQALRAAVSSGLASPLRPAEIGDSAGLLRMSVDGPAGREIALLLARSGAAPPAHWAADGGATAGLSWRASSALAEWWLGRGAAVESARALAAAGVLGFSARSSDPRAANAAMAQSLAARALETWVALGRSGEVDEVLTELASIAAAAGGDPAAAPGGTPVGDPRAAAARLALLAGRASEETARALAATLLADAAGRSGADPAALAALAVRGPDDLGAAAREVLLALVDAELERPDEARAFQLAGALNATVGGLFARGADAAAQRFWDAAMRRLASAPTHPLTLRILESGFPTPLRQEILDLGRALRVPPESLTASGPLPRVPGGGG